MNKLSFRSRPLDASKPMPVYNMDEVPEIEYYANFNRTVPQLPTGMEKEEESEHHLQRAISAQQAYGHTGQLIIPTPEVFNVPKHIKDELYPETYKCTRHLIHVQPFSMDQDIPDYDMDSEDEKWLGQQAEKLDITPIQFEKMIDSLEKSSGQRVITLKDAKLLVKDNDNIIIAVYDYWLNKRLKTQRPLIPKVKTDKDGPANINPYVAFRRRTEKMQTRKNRKNDEASYEKMLKLRRDLTRAVSLLGLVKRRERVKREFVNLKVKILEKRYETGDYSGQLLSEVSAIKHPRLNFSGRSSPIIPEPWVIQHKPNKVIGIKKRAYKRKKLDNNSNLPRMLGADMSLVDLASSEEEGLSLNQSDQHEDNNPDGPYAFKRKKNCNYHEPRLNALGNWPWCSAQEGASEDKRFRFCLTSIPGPDNRQKCIGFARKRVGRGGRIVFDRAWTPLNDHLTELDSIYSGLPLQNELVKEIKNEWKHFRAKSLDSDEDDADKENGVSASRDYSQFRRDIATTRPSSNDSSLLNCVRNDLIQDDELFEIQRTQVEQLQSDDSESVVIFDTDSSYSSLPTSSFNIASTPGETLSQ